MNKIKTLTLGRDGFPEKLTTISSPPKQLYVLGNAFGELMERPCISVVGSRKVTPYGSAVTTKLCEELARQGVVIVSGLALGIDGLAHQAAVRLGAPTIAVLPGGLDKIVPSTHYQLARQIIEHGGALVSEYPPGTDIFKTNFVARNRIVAGLGDALLITEAAQKSGTLHTVNFALEQGKDVLAVPGNITSAMSSGTNMLIKTGATPITCAEDIFNALNIDIKPISEIEVIAANKEEFALLNLLKDGFTDGNELLQRSNLEPAIFNQTLTMLEITGQVKNLGANHWTLN